MRFAGIFFASLLVTACSATRSTGHFNTGGSGGGDTSSGAGANGSGGSTGTSGGGGGFDFDAGPGDGGTGEVAEVFGQSANTLYKLDPTTKVVTTVGDFKNCAGSVIDIALDKSGQMYATTFSGLYKVDKTNAQCTLVANGSYPNSLSFVPQGTVDPNVEALVGYEGSVYVRIDTTTGAVTNIGSLGNGGYSSSGDIVSVIGGGTYLTVNGNGCSDCIIEVEPSTGALKKMIGPLGHSSVFGLAFWGGTAYGFDDFGELFAIDLTNGVSTIIPIPNAPAGLSFYGAGSSTSVPLTPPN